MRPLKIKDRCTKKKLKKCDEVLTSYKLMQYFADRIPKKYSGKKVEPHEIAVYKQDGTLLFGDFLNYAHPGWDNYSLYEKDGKEILITNFQSESRYVWTTAQPGTYNIHVYAINNGVILEKTQEEYTVK